MYGRANAALNEPDRMPETECTIKPLSESYQERKYDFWNYKYARHRPSQTYHDGPEHLETYRSCGEEGGEVKRELDRKPVARLLIFDHEEQHGLGRNIVRLERRTYCEPYQANSSNKTQTITTHSVAQA